MGSVAIADVPVPPLTFGGRFETLTDTIATLCLCFELVDVGCHHLLAKVILCSGLVNVEATAVDWFELGFVHGSIIGTGRGGSPAVLVSKRSVTLLVEFFQGIGTLCQAQ